MAPPRRTWPSYRNGIFGVVMYGLPAFGLILLFANSNMTGWWSLLTVPAAIICSFLSLLQVFGLYQEYIGNDWQRNPRTLEWTKME